MKYSRHKILPTGHINIREINEDGGYHRFVISPNQTVDKYNEQIEADPDFEKYRTQENAEAYEQKLKESGEDKQKSKERREKKQKARKALEKKPKNEKEAIEQVEALKEILL